MKTQVFNIKKSIGLAAERTEKELPSSVDNTVADILSEFEHLSTEQIQSAIRKGALGYTGQTYGRLSTQTICIWIRAAAAVKPVYKL